MSLNYSDKNHIFCLIKKLLILFTLFLSVLGCAPELTVLEGSEKKGDGDKGHHQEFRTGKQGFGLVGRGKVNFVLGIRILVARSYKVHKADNRVWKA